MGNVKADADKRTSVAKVFTAGDMTRGQSLIVWAIAEGRHAAHSIDEFLRGHRPAQAPRPRQPPRRSREPSAGAGCEFALRSYSDSFGMIRRLNARRERRNPPVTRSSRSRATIRIRSAQGGTTSPGLGMASTP